MFLALSLDTHMIDYYLSYVYNWIYSLSPEFIERFMMLLTAPLDHREMLWIVLPMVATILIMELYFGVYVSEELGWNSAVGNSIFLIFVAIDLFRQIYWTNPVLGEMLRTLTIIAGTVALLGLMMLVLNFAHALPRKIAFELSSTLPVNIFGYIAIILVYTNLPGVYSTIPIDRTTMIAALGLYIVLFSVFGFIHMFEPHSYDA